MGWKPCRLYLKHVLALSHLQQVDDGLVAVGSHAGVLVFRVVQQGLQDGLGRRGVEGREGGFVGPPDHLFCNQLDVAGRILETLRRDEKTLGGGAFNTRGGGEGGCTGAPSPRNLLK